MCEFLFQEDPIFEKMLLEIGKRVVAYADNKSSRDYFQSKYSIKTLFSLHSATGYLALNPIARNESNVSLCLFSLCIAN